MLTIAEIESLLTTYLAKNKTLGYGIAVQKVSGDTAGPPIIDVELRFLSDREYCCIEPGCHLPWNLSRLPQLAGYQIRWHCMVEPGVLLTAGAVPGTPRVDPGGCEFEFVTGTGSLPQSLGP